MTEVWVASARAGRVPVEARGALLEAWRALPGVLLETCHRVELYGTGPTPPSLAKSLPAACRIEHGAAAAEHAVAVALGLDSVIVAEDQVLFQLRTAVEVARRRGNLGADVERLFDMALRAGRRGRSWLPARRPSLADLALAALPVPLEGTDVLVIGAGRMGELAARAAFARGARASIASRTLEHAVAVAQRLRLASAPFDPGASVDRYAAIVIALAGAWPVSASTMAALVSGRAHVVDLSSPPAVPAALRLAMGERFHSVDELADAQDRGPGEAILRRLRMLAAATVDEYLNWAAREGPRDAARQMAERAERIRGVELAELWRRVPSLPEEQRRQIEQMTERLASRLLREPLERLGRDTDGQGERAARELFRL